MLPYRRRADNSDNKSWGQGDEWAGVAQPENLSAIRRRSCRPGASGENQISLPALHKVLAWLIIVQTQIAEQNINFGWLHYSLPPESIFMKRKNAQFQRWQTSAFLQPTAKHFSSRGHFHHFWPSHATTGRRSRDCKQPSMEWRRLWRWDIRRKAC